MRRGKAGRCGGNRLLGGRFAYPRFLYVEDAAEALVLAAERYDGAEPVNIGGTEEIAVRDLVETIADFASLRDG